MKKTLLTLGLAFSALALTASTKAATASANNVYLGFEDINAGYDVIFDLGAQSSSAPSPRKAWEPILPPCSVTGKPTRISTGVFSGSQPPVPDLAPMV